MLTYDDLLELVRKRRSNRRFKPDPVSDDLVDKIIEVARWAPSGANSQPWEFVVIKEKETREKIYEIIAAQGEMNRRVEMTRPPELRHHTGEPGRRPGYMDAPVFIIACGDPRLRACYPASAALTRGKENLISGMASAFLYMHLAATTLGLGSQWVSTTASAVPQAQLKVLLNIPTKLEIYDMMVLGYPSGQPRPKLTRERAEMVHREKFDVSRFKTGEQVKQYVMSVNRGGAAAPNRP